MKDVNEKIFELVAEELKKGEMSLEELEAYKQKLQILFPDPAKVQADKEAAAAHAEEYSSFPRREVTEELLLEAQSSINNEFIKCMECGETFKALVRHIKHFHGLTEKEYVAKWGLPKGTSLTCNDFSKVRKDRMKEMRLWERRKTALEAASNEKPATPVTPEQQKPATPVTPEQQKPATPIAPEQDKTDGKAKDKGKPENKK